MIYTDYTKNKLYNTKQKKIKLQKYKSRRNKKQLYSSKKLKKFYKNVVIKNLMDIFNVMSYKNELFIMGE